MFCKNCGTENLDTAKFCKNCGQILSTEEAAPAEQDVTMQPETPVEEASASSKENTSAYTGPVDYTASSTSASYAGPVDYNSDAHSVTNDSELPENTGTAIASMVLGIVSIVLCCSSLLGVICGVIAIVLAQKEKNEGRGESGFVKAGLICGIIGAILSGLALLYYIVIMIIGGTASIYNDIYRF